MAAKNIETRLSSVISIMYRFVYSLMNLMTVRFGLLIGQVLQGDSKHGTMLHFLFWKIWKFPLLGFLKKVMSAARRYHLLRRHLRTVFIVYKSLVMLKAILDACPLPSGLPGESEEEAQRQLELSRESLIPRFDPDYAQFPQNASETIPASLGNLIIQQHLSI
jgi:hypothetical protein